MNSRITLTHHADVATYSVELAIPTFGSDPLTYTKSFCYGHDAPFETAVRALIAAETYAEAAGDMARLMSKGSLDHNAGGFIARMREAREISASSL
jgi:hypothetical protein